jgi:CBS domain-containing protein
MLPSYALLQTCIGGRIYESLRFNVCRYHSCNRKCKRNRGCHRIVLGAINGIPVISKAEGKLLGVVTTIDILRAIRTGGDLTTIIAKEIMSPDPFSVKEDTDVNELIDIMDKNGIMMLPVIEDDGRLIGVCSRSDVLKEILNERFVTIDMTKTITRTIGDGA